MASGHSRLGCLISWVSNLNDSCHLGQHPTSKTAAPYTTHNPQSRTIGAQKALCFVHSHSLSLTHTHTYTHGRTYIYYTQGWGTPSASLYVVIVCLEGGGYTPICVCGRERECFP